MNITENKFNKNKVVSLASSFKIKVKPQIWWRLPMACICLASSLTMNNVSAATIEADGVKPINVQPLERRQQLTYCFDSSWNEENVVPGQEGYKELIKTALPIAEKEWEQWADIDFRYRPELDGDSCTNDGTGAYFIIKLFQSMESGMDSFRPYHSEAERRLDINQAWIGKNDSAKYPNILTHEFGHILGFQHEERSLPDTLDGNGNPYDTTKLQRLTPFDYGGVMMKPWHDLATSPNGTYNMTDFDRLAALCIYTNGISFSTCLGQSNQPWESDVSGVRNGSDYIWKSNGSQHQSVKVADFRSLSNDLRIPVSGDFNGDGIDDIFWYGRGDMTDVIDFGDGTKVHYSIKGLYDPFSGDFNGDGRDDIFFYGAGTSPDWIWFGRADKKFDSRQYTVNGSYQVLVGDFDADGVDDIFWYRPGAHSDFLWYFNHNKTYESHPMDIDGTYRPVVGDFNGDGDTDILWHTPGNAADPLWLGRQGMRGESAFIKRSETVNGNYYPFAGDFDGDGADEIFWYSPGSGLDPVWKVGPNGFETSRYENVNGYYSPFVGDFDGDGDDDIFWYAPL